MVPAIFFLTFCLSINNFPKQPRFVKISFPDGFKLTAELAITEEQRQQGLMYREGMKEDQGMLFIFEEEDIYSFWMKNMRFSLDILWLDSSRRIVHFEENVPACVSEPCPSYEPSRPARYVLELVSGSVRKHSLKLGDRLEFILPPDLRLEGASISPEHPSGNPGLFSYR